jgi:hypothetical protein
MKIAAKILLAAILVPLTIIFLLAVCIRFQLMSPRFWKSTLEDNDAYAKVSETVRMELEEQAVAGGGQKSDAAILTDLLSETNIRDFVNKNIDNILRFANGKSEELLVYVPMDVVPESFLSPGFTEKAEEIKLSDLVRDFDISGITEAQINSVSRFGLWSWVIFYGSFLVLLAVVCLIHLLTGPGKRMAALALPFFLSGLVAFGVSMAGRVLLAGFLPPIESHPALAAALVGVVLQSISDSLLNFWRLSGLIMLLGGLGLVLIKKPYNKANG